MVARHLLLASAPLVLSKQGVDGQVCAEYACMSRSYQWRTCIAGLEDMNFWDGMAMEDPLMQAMEAAMGCTDESENCCFHATLSEV